MDTGDGVLGTNMYAYCLNDPVNGWDPSGYWVETVWDAISLAMSVNDMINDPRLANAGWLLLDVASVIIPVVPALGSVDNVAKGGVKIVGKIDDVADASKAAKVAQKAFKALDPGKVADMLVGAKRTGSALKPDLYHKAAGFVSRSQLAKGQIFLIKGGDGVYRILLQTLGELNGKKGVFEFLLDPNGVVTHQLFKPGKVINGIIN
jgi:hypothetical protein